MNKPQYINLHNHSHFSTLDAVTKIEDAVKFNKDNGLSHACFTEHGTLSSAYSLAEECKKAGIKPVFGIEAYYVGDLTSQESQVKYCYSHLIILCKNEKGWRNLKRIQFMAWRDGFMAKPRVSWNMLEKYHEGLIISTACIAGILNQPIFDERMKLIYPELSDRVSLVTKRIKKFKRVFGKDFYAEIMLNDLPDQKKCNKNVLKFAKQFDLPVIITNDTHYVKKEDYQIHDVIKCVNFGKGINDPDNGTYETKQLYYMTEKGITRLWKKNGHSYITEKELIRYMANTVKIVEPIEVFDIRTKSSALPEFAGDREKAKDMLLKICKTGIRRRFNKSMPFTDEYQKRLDYELVVINKLGMADYMLIVWDIARVSREKNIPFSTRGSVAGSLVAYLIGISWIDPIMFDTTFERFLTEDRLSLPDIDMDFSSVRRMELVQYLRERYGDENVAHIVNFGIYHPKTAIKDVAKVYGVPFNEVNRMTKSITDNITKWEEIPLNTEVNTFKEKYPEIWDLSRRMLDISRSRGVHASGVVLTPKNNIYWTPVAWSTLEDKDTKDRVTEFDMYGLEELGILKLDFLGQTTLDVIQTAFINISKKDESLKTLDDLFIKVIDNLKDKEVFKEIRAGNLAGMFQMGTSRGMKELIIDMKCENIEDIIVCITLYRTAILQVGAHVKYVKRKFGREKITYIHPKMGEVLDSTQGIILYQEQTMKLPQVLAGFTASESDNFRKGIKQKDSEKFMKWKERFVSGCKTTSNIDEDTALKIWEEIFAWSGYGFNRSHAVAYGLIAYMTAWLKIHYPVEFMTALLTCNAGDDQRLSTYLIEANRMKIDTQDPDINISTKSFRYLKEKIIFPFTVIKNVGDKAIESILLARKNGKFADFEDFYNRINKRQVNVRVINHLIFANAFRSFGSMDKIYNQFKSLHKSDKTIREICCGSCDFRYPVSITPKDAESKGVVCPECGDTDVIYGLPAVNKKKFNRKYCKRLVYGFIGGDVLQPYLGDFIEEDAVVLSEINENDANCKTGGMVKKINIFKDKNQNEMAFILMTDGNIEKRLVVFSRDWSAIREKPKVGQVFIFFAKNDGESLILKGRLNKLLAKA